MSRVAFMILRKGHDLILVRVFDAPEVKTDTVKDEGGCQGLVLRDAVNTSL